MAAIPNDGYPDGLVDEVDRAGYDVACINVLLGFDPGGTGLDYASIPARDAPSGQAPPHDA